MIKAIEIRGNTNGGAGEYHVYKRYRVAGFRVDNSSFYNRLLRDYGRKTG